jgi:hypothetical protein
LYLENEMYKSITKEEARTLAELGTTVYNRYRNADRGTRWNEDWSTWKAMVAWEAEDWDNLDLGRWEDEFRVEVE